MKQITKLLTTVLIGCIVALPLTACKVQDQPEPEETEPINYRSICEDIGTNYWKSLKAQNISEIANLSNEEIRSDFITDSENFFTSKEAWEGEFFSTYLPDLQIVQGTYEENGAVATIDYTLVIDDYRNVSGGLLSYKVQLNFVLKDGVAYLTNPELALNIYEDMLDDYARYVVTYIVYATPTPIPEPTATPKPTATPVPKETEATATTASETTEVAQG